MTAPHEIAERRRLNAVAREYRKKGYRVFVRPIPDELPAFLHGFEPDMIALGDHESVVVEVRSKRTLTDPTQHLGKLAEAVNAQQGWRLELVVTNPRHDDANLPRGVEPDVREIWGKVGTARELLDDGQTELAALVAWSAVEAAPRRVAAANDIALDYPQPEWVIRQLVIDGVLGQDDYSLLRQSLRERHLIVLGFQPEARPDDWVPRPIERTTDLLSDVA